MVGQAFFHTVAAEIVLGYRTVGAGQIEGRSALVCGILKEERHGERQRHRRDGGFIA